ncbi:MAG: hypothetical protein B6245_01370 [Desulfobacteraceae bacterium 4572_88]|nr:MAG: hypothetical protein B6245_01370 [Desulfobacteraceae bacterium 4572_88]
MRKDKIMEFRKFGILAVFFCFVPSLTMAQSNYYVATMTIPELCPSSGGRFRKLRALQCM